MSSRPEVALVGLLVVGIGLSFTDWAHSGRAGRSSYELVRSADRLGLLEGRVASVGAVVWFFLPLVGAAAVVALAFGRRRLGAVLGAIVGGLLIVGWLKVKSSPLSADAGSEAGALCGLAIVLVAAWALSSSRGARDDRRPLDTRRIR